MIQERSQKKTIIVIESDPSLAGLVTQTLNDAPEYEAVAVPHGSSALEILRSVKARLVLIDVALPGLSGFETYDMLQVDLDMRGIPVIFYASRSSEEELLARGITRYLLKPLDLNELLTCVDEVCSLYVE
jgi:DNA-binding response OmpR family regulator